MPIFESRGAHKMPLPRRNALLLFIVNACKTTQPSIRVLSVDFRAMTVCLREVGSRLRTLPTSTSIPAARWFDRAIDWSYDGCQSVVVLGCMSHTTPLSSISSVSDELHAGLVTLHQTSDRYLTLMQARCERARVVYRQISQPIV